MGNFGKLTLKLVDPVNVIQKAVNEAIAKEVNKKIRSNAKKLEARIKATAKVWLRSQPEIQSLIDAGVPDSLNSHFGLDGQGLEAVDVIIESVLQTTYINNTPFSKDLNGSLTITIQPKEFNNLLALSVGHNLQYRESDLHWLDWLLLKGDSAIIIGYHYNAGFGEGRAGGGKMDAGGLWRVPPQFSGTSQNNFITRAFEGRETELTTMLRDVLEK